MSRIKLLREVDRIELDTIGRIANAARKQNIPRERIPEYERINKEYFAKVQALVTKHLPE